MAEALGITVRTLTLDDTAAEDDLVHAIRAANDDPGVHGILVLLPLPDQVAPKRVLLNVAPEKELEGLVESQDTETLPSGKKPSTIAAVLALLKELELNIVSCRIALIIEDDILEGNPIVTRLLELMANLNVSVDIIATSNPEARAIASHADVVLVSVAKPEYVDAAFLKEGAVVIDLNPVAVSRKYSEEKGRLVPVLKNGVNLEAALSRAGYVSPALVGVGPVALAMMMKNFVANYKMFSVSMAAR
jgi:5,10-methylene-tetrahydrofolate dehydrogenase/methenyl tetrahydrofolate cyclohydrolase